MNTSANKVRAIGQHDAIMVENLARVVIHHWVELHRYGRSEAPNEAKSRVLEILGGGVFEWCWTALTIYREPLQSENPDSLIRLYEHLCKPNVRPTLCNKVCFSVSMISARMQALSKLAKKAKKDEAKDLWRAYNYLFEVLYELLNTGALAEMPNSSRHARLDEVALANLVTCLPVHWCALKRRASASGQVGCVSAQIGLTLGLPVFAGLRAQEEGRVAQGSEALMDWYMTPQARKLRGFYADLGASVHGFSQAAKALRTYRKTQPMNTPRRTAASAAIFAVEEAMMAVIDSGALYSIP